MRRDVTMNIFTEYNVIITIDGKDYNLIAKELDAKGKKEIEALASGLNDAELLSREANQKREDIEANKALAECVGLIDKAKLLWENKNLIRDVRAIEDKLSNFYKTGATDKLLMSKLEMTIAGTDRENFLSVIKEKNISPQLVLEKISEEITSRQKGKSTDLSASPENGIADKAVSI